MDKQTLKKSSDKLINSQFSENFQNRNNFRSGQKLELKQSDIKRYGSVKIPVNPLNWNHFENLNGRKSVNPKANIGQNLMSERLKLNKLKKERISTRQPVDQRNYDLGLDLEQISKNRDSRKLKRSKVQNNPQRSGSPRKSLLYSSSKVLKETFHHKPKKLRLSEIKNCYNLKQNTKSRRKKLMFNRVRSDHKRMAPNLITKEPVNLKHHHLNQIPLTSRARVSMGQKKNFYKTGSKFKEQNWRKDQLFADKLGGNSISKSKLTNQKLSEIQGFHLKRVLREKFSGSKGNLTNFESDFRANMMGMNYHNDRKFEKTRSNILKMNSIRKKNKRSKISNSKLY